MSDPISLVLGTAITTAVAGKVTEKVVEYLHDALRGQSEEAKRQAAENTRRFLLDLAERLRYIEGRLGLPREESAFDMLDAGLGDPDFTIVFRAAALAAARTGDAEKHDLLARSI